MSWTVISPERLDVFLLREAGAISRGSAQRAIEDGKVTINGKVVTKSSLKLQTGDVVALTEALVREDDGTIEPVDLKLHVLYEDDVCFVLDKPSGIAVHPGAGMLPGEKTVLHGVAHLFKKWKLPFSPDAVLVHRLDRETTGCLLVAKTQEAHQLLQKQFESRTVKKFYLAIIAGIPAQDKAVIDAPIGRSTSDRTKMGISRMSNPREARTSYEVLDKSDRSALLLCELHTGRTHQIRVHFQAIGHPLIGDDKYFTAFSQEIAEDANIDSLCLHAWKLTFVSPADKKEHVITAPLPSSFMGSLKKLGMNAEIK